MAGHSADADKSERMTGKPEVIPREELPTTRPVISRFWHHESDKAILRQELACNYSRNIKVLLTTSNDPMLLNLIAEGMRLSGAERSAVMEHLIHFSQKVTS